MADWMHVIAYQAHLAGANDHSEAVAAFRSGHIGLALAIEHSAFALTHWQSLPEPVRREAAAAARALASMSPLTSEVPA